MPLYKNNGGAHTLLDGTTIPHGGTFESDDPNLLKKFRGKFERVIIEAVTPEPPCVQAPSEASAQITQDVNTEEEEKTPVQKAAEKGAEFVLPEGSVDVTDEFPTAKDADIRVLKDKRGWWVYDFMLSADDTNNEPANDKPLRKKDVGTFIDDLLAE